MTDEVQNTTEPFAVVSGITGHVHPQGARPRDEPPPSVPRQPSSVQPPAAAMDDQPKMIPLKLMGVPPPTVQDFHQILAEAVIGLAVHLGQQHQPGIQALVQAAFLRQHALNNGTIKPG